MPPTPRNVVILDAYGDNKVNTIPCRVLMNGVVIAPNARLLFSRQTIADRQSLFDVTILYGNFNLFDDIKKGTIDQMNWSDLSYQHDAATFVALSTNTIH